MLDKGYFGKIENVSRKDIEKKVEELCSLIDKLEEGEKEGYKSEAAEYTCFQVVAQVAHNHYEGTGILMEALMTWRNISSGVLEDEENTCLDCEEKKKDAPSLN